jgi:drug/metabolite transporter (DMT)-like permease
MLAPLRSPPTAPQFVVLGRHSITILPMSAPLCMVIASLLFALMGVCVKWASAQYSAGEIVFYRALVGVVYIAVLTRRSKVSLRTSAPAMHFWRSATGVAALMLWFYAITGLPLATAMTLNYMSSVWMALFLIGGAVLVGGQKLDNRLVATVLVGFFGVALVLRPTIEQQQLWHGLIGLLSGVLAAMAYLQVTTLGRSGEPEERIVFYFSVGGVVAGGVWTALLGAAPHTLRGVGLLLAIGLLAVVAQMLMTRAYRIGRTLSNASLQYLGIAHSFVFGVLLFNDPITVFAVVGMLLIVAAGIAATTMTNDRLPAATHDK